MSTLLVVVEVPDHVRGVAVAEHGGNIAGSEPRHIIARHGADGGNVELVKLNVVEHRSISNVVIVRLTDANLVAGRARIGVPPVGSGAPKSSKRARP